MPPETDESYRTMLIGPGLDPAAPLEADEGEDLDHNSPRAEGRRLLSRLLIAFILLALIAFICFGVLPRVGIYLPAWIPLAAFAVITVGVLMNATSEGLLGPSSEDQRSRTDKGCGCSGGAGGSDGRPVGCCPGPRPPGFLGGGRGR